MKRLLLFESLVALVAEAGCPTSCPRAGQNAYDDWGSLHGTWYDESEPHITKCGRHFSQHFASNTWDFTADRLYYANSLRFDDEWSIKFYIYLRGRPNTIAPNNFSGKTGQTLFHLDSYLTNGATRNAFSIIWHESDQHLGFQCWACPSVEPYGKVFSFKNMAYSYNTWIKIELRQVKQAASYESNYSSWRANNRIQLFENDIIKQDHYTEKDPLHTYYQVFAGPVNPHIETGGFGYTYLGSPPQIGYVEIRSTKIETCDKCTAGQHKCVENALCTDLNMAFNHESITRCECKAGFVGQGQHRCRDCNTGYNCSKLMAGCGVDNYPYSFSKSSLISCLASHRDDIKINNVVHSKEVINGVRNGANFQFYKGPTEFIYYDKEYQEWRIGGSMAPTRSVDCSSVNIC